ncbi:MAG: alpha/beta hydrolase, partial [Bacteroidota bacterium]
VTFSTPGSFVFKQPLTTMHTQPFFVAVIILLHPFMLSANAIQFEDYLFVSNQQDTVEAELGQFRVPENRSHPDGKQLTLKLIRFKSTNPNPGSPIIYLSGGPGGSGSGTAKRSRFQLFMQLREVADVIAFDQRGTGLSNELPRCPDYLQLDLLTPYQKEDYLKETTGLIQNCLSFYQEEGHDLSAYNTTESAADIEDLRKALAVEKISLWGISYGSHLAFEYIRQYESKLDKVVLASLEGPDEMIKLPSNTEAFLKEICARAADNYGFEPKYPELPALISEVHKQLRQKPVVVSYTDRRGQPDTVAISEFELQATMASFFLKNPEDSKKLPAAYAKMATADFSEIAPLVAIMKKYYLTGFRPMSFAMDMASGISGQRRQQVKNELDKSTLGYINFFFLEWLDQIDFPTLPDVFRTLPESQVDILLLSGTLDGRTYLPAAKTIAQQFPNGQHIIIDNAGHDLFMASPVIGDLIQRYFEGKKLRVQSLQLAPTPFE